MHVIHRPRLGRRSALVGAGLLLLTTATVGTPAAGAAPKPTSSKATAGDVTAVVKYTRSARSANPYRDLRLTVTGPTGSLTKVKLGKVKDSFSRPRVSLSDVNADGVVDAIVDTYSGGAHCCTSSSIALSTGTGWAKPFTQFWGNYGYTLEDLGGAPGIEFSSFDDGFAYAFSSYAASFPAIRILRVKDGALADVTREHPDAIRADLAEKQKLYDEIVAGAAKEDYPNDVAQSAAAALMADHLLLGDVEAAKAVLAKLGTDGFLKKPGKDEAGVSGTAFKKALVKNFVAWGYLTSGAQLGL